MGSLLRLATILLTVTGTALAQCNVQNFCSSNPNSTGAAAVIWSNGHCSTLDNTLELFAGPVPSNQFGLFFFSANVQAGGIGTPFGDGRLCIGGGSQIYRLPVLAVQGNQLDYQVDLNTPPATVIQEGTSYYFQAWYRDPFGATSTYNTSDGLEITFQAEASPTVQVAASTQVIGEGEGSGRVMLDLSSASGLPVTVPFSVTGGSATEPDDFAMMVGGQVVIPPGQTQWPIDFSLVGDSLFEGDEDFIVTIGTPTHATLGALVEQTVTIQEDDPLPVVRFLTAADSVGEGEGTTTIVFELDTLAGVPVTIPFTVSGTADVPGDASLSSSFMVIPAGQLQRVIIVTVTQDTLPEGDETVILTLGAPTNGVLGSPIEHTLTLIDDDTAPVLTFTSGSQAVGEGAGTAQATLSLSALSGANVTIPFTVSGTADDPADGSVSASPVMIPAGQLSTTVDLSIVQDAIHESAESFVVTLGAPTGATLGAIDAHTFMIVDDDPEPTVSFASANSSVSEGAGTTQITVELNTISALDVSVSLATSGSATVPDDATHTASPLLIPAGQTSTTVDVNVVSDGLFEGDEVLVFDLTSPSGATLGATPQHSLTLLEDDPMPTVSFTAASGTASEGDAAFPATLALSGVSGADVIVPFTLGGTATLGGDVTVTASPVTIPAGQLSVPLEFTPIQDPTDELDETVIADLGAPTGATLGATTQFVFTLTDDDAAPTVTFSAPSASVGEAAGSTQATVEIDVASSLDVTVPFTVSGTASDPDDGAVGASPVVIPAGQLSVPIDVTIVSDLLDELNETFVLDLGTPVNGQLGATVQHTLTITDDDAAPVIGFAAATSSSGEADGLATVTVQLGAPSGLEVSVPFTVSGTADDPADISVSASPVVIPAGQVSATVDVTIVQDLLDEADETVILDLGTPTNATVGLAQHTLTVLDDDLPPAVSFSTSAQSAGEGAGLLPVTVTLDAISSFDVTVPFTVSGTADGNDATVSAGPLVIPAGQLSGTIDVTATDDLLDELDETVILDLGAPTNAVLGATAQHTVTLTDDDATPTVGFSVATSGAGEADGLVQIQVDLDAPSGLEVSVPFTLGGTAIEPDDLTVAASPLVIPAGQTSATIDVTLVSDAVDEPNETLILDLGAPTNAVLGAAQHTLTITDDDLPPTIEFRFPTSSRPESVGTVQIEVELDVPSAFEVTAPFNIVGTASVPGDATVSASPVVIPAGQTSVFVDVTLVSDTLDEEDETVRLRMVSPTNATLGARDRHTLTIVDDDAPPVVAFSLASSNPSEAAGAVQIQVELDAASGLDVTVPFTLAGTATVPGDASVSASPVMIPAGQTTALIDVTIVADTLDEDDETVVIDLGAPTNATLGAQAQHTLTIADDDAAPVVSFSAGSSNPSEAAGLVQVQVELDAASGLPITVPFSLSGTATVPGDATVSVSPLVIAAGQTTALIDVTITSDSVDELDETIVIDLGAPTNATLGAPAQHTLTIADDDATPTVAFTAAAQSVSEGSGLVQMTVELSAVSGLEVSVPFSHSGTANVPADATLGASPLVIPAGQTTATLDVTVLQDALDELDEDLILTLGVPTNAGLGVQDDFTLTITDDDPSPVITFTLPSQTMAEAGPFATCEVNIDAVSGLDVSVPFTLSGTATENADYTSSPVAGTLLIPAGQLTVEVVLTPLQDQEEEGDETVILTLGAPTNATLGANPIHTVTVVDDEAAIGSDDFNHCEGLVAPWSFVDPVGDATVEVTGVGTNDAWLRLGVPGGSDHDPFHTNLTARIEQPFRGGDAQLTASFVDVPQAAIQQQGLLVIESDQRWLRFDIYHDGTELVFFVGTTTAGVTTTTANVGVGTFTGRVDLRLTRTGDDFVAEWSTDGVSFTPVSNFTFALAPTTLGVYAGNGGGAAAPAYEAQLDFFESATVPITTEDGSFPGAGPFTLDTFTAGTGTGTVQKSPDQPDYLCRDEVTLTATPGAGSSFVEWQGDATGSQNPLVVTTDAAKSITAVFDADVTAPVISNVQVVTGRNTATVTWDTNEPATSLVDYGLTNAYGSVVFDPGFKTSHVVVLNGLLESTVYHFRVCSQDNATNSACTADDTFMTDTSSGLVSDDFNHCGGLLSPWTYLNGSGDGSYLVSGVGSQDAWISLSVPGGSDHDPFDASPLPPRIAQPVFDVDFEFEVKFESQVTAGIQQQGVLIEQDADDWIRFDVYSTGSKTYAYVGSTVSGNTATEAQAQVSLTSPMYLRVGRINNGWTMSTSPDGTNWTQLVQFTRAMVTTQVSIYGGNSGGVHAPAHTAVVDWFQDTSEPLATEDGSAPGSGPYVLTTQVSGSGSIQRSPDQPDYLCTDVVTLTAVPAGGWTFSHWTGDIGGSVNPETVAMGGNRSVTAVFVQDVSPPVITNLSITPGQTSALVTWDTDEPATSRVEFGPTAAYGSVEEDLTLRISHSVKITGLTADSEHHLRACSSDAGNLTSCTADQLFFTQVPWGLVSDDFNQCTGLLGHWTFVDPQMDAMLDVIGVGTPDANLRLHVPAGVEHQAFGTIHAPHVTQAVDDVDFQFEVKLDAVPSQAYEIEGMLIIEHSGEWLRFDAYHDGNQVRVFAGVHTGGSTSTLSDVAIGSVPAPLWLRVTREGDLWTYEYSVDGANWFATLSAVTHAMTVTEAGLYAGNAVGAASPAFAGVFDYAVDTANPITNEDGAFGGSGPFTVTATASPGVGGSVQLNPSQPDYSCSDVVEFTAVPNAGYKFDHWTGDLSGSTNPQSLTMSTDRVVEAVFVLDTVPPVISNIQVSPGPTYATVTWETDEPADSLLEYGLTTSYTDSESDSLLVTQHVLQITGLTPGTQYQFRVCSMDLSSNNACSSNSAFTTIPDGGVISDDFNHPNVDTSFWTFTDPLGEAEAPRILGPCTTDALLELRVPSGTEYLGWITNNHLRLTQPIQDTDFELEAKLETDFTQQYQSAGILVQEDADTWLRFSFQHDGSGLRILSASFDAGAASNVQTTSIQSGTWTGTPIWMRVTRIGNQWTQSYSTDGTNWFANGSAFVFACVPAEAGVMAGNELPGNHALNARFDYFFSTASPVNPEDFGCPSDTTPPLQVVDGRVSSDTSVRINWSTDELTTSEVRWGLVPGVYDQGPMNGAALVYDDFLIVPGLTPETTYHFQVTSTDGDSNVTQSADLELTTPPLGFDGLPDFEVWYGTPNGSGEPVLRFGHLGMAQTWCNIPGRVTDELGAVVSLNYTLDNGTNVLGPFALTVEGSGGVDVYRLVDAGDFNIEIDPADLASGLNEVTLTATDDDGNMAQQTVWVDYTPGNTWPLPVTVDWSTVTDLQDAAQFVDGYFRIDNATGTPMLRNYRDSAPVYGYDRLFCIGDQTWDDYEFVTDFEVHSLNPNGFTPGSNSHAFGVIMRWPGHNGGVQQPQEQFFPLGGLMAYRWYSVTDEYWNAYSTSFSPNLTLPPFFMPVDEGQHYMMRGQVDTQPNGDALYRLRMWDVGAPEPANWFFEMTVPAGGVASGSLLFIVHDVDASIGNITFTPL